MSYALTPPGLPWRGCPHDGGELLRDALGEFIGEVCGRVGDDEDPDPGG